jgi:PhnB protein
MSRTLVKPISVGFYTLTPHLMCRDASAAIDFYVKAFGTIETFRLPGPNGKLMHAEVRIGDSPLMLFNEMPEWCALSPQSLSGSPVTLHLYVEDADAAVARAVDAGAKIAMPLADTFWGDGFGQIANPFGHNWSLATHLRDVSLEETQAGMTKACSG